MDEAVEEVFQLMLERSCRAIAQPLTTPPDFCARIILSGALDAQCIVEFPTASARNLTRALLGSATCQWDDTLVADAVGELCNMIAGGWKKGLGAPGWEANLSVPSLARSPAHCAPESCGVCLRRDYTFDNSPFAVTLTTRKAAESPDPAARENPSA
jgi:chemotaxis protein CheX